MCFSISLAFSFLQVLSYLSKLMPIFFGTKYKFAELVRSKIQYWGNIKGRLENSKDSFLFKIRFHDSSIGTVIFYKCFRVNHSFFLFGGTTLSKAEDDFEGN